MSAMMVPVVLGVVAAIFGGIAVAVMAETNAAGASFGVVMLVAFVVGITGAHLDDAAWRDDLRESGYAIDRDADGRIRIGIASTPQPTVVRWLATPGPTATDGAP